MTRAQLEHVIRAATQIADDDELIVVGSTSEIAGIAGLLPLQHDPKGRLDEISWRASAATLHPARRVYISYKPLARA